MVTAYRAEPVKLKRKAQTDHAAPKPRSKRSRRAEWAARVFDHIPAGDAAVPISGSDLCALAGLTLNQVQNGVEELRDQHPDLPLVSSTKGYIFTTEMAAVAAYRGARAKSAHTTIRRLWDGTIKPYISQPGFNRNEARQTTKEFERVIEDLADILA